MNKWVKSLAQWATLASVTVWSCGPVRAQSAPKPTDRIRDSERRQQDIRTQTQKTADQLGAIIDEFDRNNLGGEEIQVLKAIQSVLGGLSETQMKQVVDLLQKAREQADPNAARRTATDAYAGQRQIIVQMQQLLLEYQKQKDLAGLAIQLAQLAERQGKHLHDTVVLARATGNRPAEQFSDQQRSSLATFVSDQQSLNQEVKLVLDKAQSMAGEDGGRLADLLAKAKAPTGKLQGALDGSLSSLKGSNVFSAAGSQKSARDELRLLARQIAPPKDRTAALRAALQELGQIIDLQKQVQNLTQDTPTAKFDAQDLEFRQADVLDKSDLLQKDLVTLAPAAGREMKNAEDRMQEARTSLLDKQKDPALATEKLALASLEKARGLLEEELRLAEESKLANADPATKIGELQKEVQALIKDQEKLKTETAAGERDPKQLAAAAPRQKELEAKAEAIQREVAPVAPKASEPMGEAVKQMDKAQQNLANAQQPRNPAPQQQSAINNLKKADEMLGEELKKIEQAKEDLKAVEEAMAKIAKLIVDQEGIERDTAKNAGASTRPVAAATTQPTPAPKDLAKEEQGLSTRTQEVRTGLQAAEEEAGPPLDTARTHMNVAQGRLDQSDSAGARPPEKDALAALHKAMDALQRKADALRQEAGQPPQDPMASTMEQVQQVQKDVEKAQDQAPPPTEAQKLQEQQQQIAQDLEQMNQEQPNNPQLQQAQRAAEQAAQQLAQNNPQQAVQQMQQAQKAMQQAQQNPPQEQAQPPQNPAEPQAGEPHQGEPHEGEPHQGEPHAGEPHAGEPHAGEPHAGEPHAGEPQAGEPHAGLPELGQQQAQLIQQAQKLAAQPQPAPNAAAQQQMAATLEQAAQKMDQLAASPNQLPNQVEQAMQQAQQALSQAAAQAANNQVPQQAMAQAQQALAEAQAAMAMAQAMPEQGPPHQGPPHPGNEPGKHPANEMAASQQPQDSHRTDINSNVTNGGPRGDVKETGSFIGLPPRDRAAIEQTQKEKYPEAYGPQVQQYMKNLAEEGK